jgi:hypothetical protein
VVTDVFAQFLRDYPEYASTARLDDLGAFEYGRLDVSRVQP